VPDQAELVLKAKDLFLAGRSTTQIAEALTLSGLFPKSGRWYPQTVKSILVNPLYAGVVRWGVSRSQLDPRSGRTHKNRKSPPEQVVSGPGKHQPLWDDFTHRSILAEFRKRGHSYRGRATQRFTSLLSCGVCGQRLWTFYNTSVRPDNLIWRCSSRLEHVSILNSEAIHLVGVAIANDLMRLDPKERPSSELGVSLRSELMAAKGERDRLGDAYQAGADSVDEFLRRASPLDDRISDLERSLARADGVERDWLAREQAIYYLQENLRFIPGFLASAPAQEVNHLLRSVLSDVIVEGSDLVRLVWR
jgi:hypothetical protein